MVCEKCSRRKCKSTYYLERKYCKCKLCPPGQKPTAIKGDKCEPLGDKSGQCPLGQVLDPSTGGQDKNTAKPECLPDDADQCGPGQVPQSREKADKYIKLVTCVKDTDEKDKPICKSSEYRHVDVYESDTGPSAQYSCRKTRKFEREKNAKFEETRSRKKLDFDKQYQERKRIEQENKEKDEKLQDKIQKEKDKNTAEEADKAEKERVQTEGKSRKKARMGKCLTLVPLCFSAGTAIVGGWDLSDGFFSDEFVFGDDLLALWPTDLATVPAASIDTDEYLSKFVDAVSSPAWIGNNPPNCKQYRSLDALQVDTPTVLVSPNTEMICYRPQKRFIGLIFDAIIAFAIGLTPIILRISASSARLARIVKNGGVRLARSGEKSGKWDDMISSAKMVARNMNWRRCLEGLDPTQM